MATYQLVESDFSTTEHGKTLFSTTLQKYIDDGFDEILFPPSNSPFHPEVIHLVKDENDPIPEIKLKTDLTLSISFNFLKLLYGNMDVRLNGFRFNLVGHNAIIHMGLAKTQVHESIDLKSGDPIKVVDAGKFKKGDFLRTSFVECGITHRGQLTIDEIDKTPDGYDLISKYSYKYTSKEGVVLEEIKNATHNTVLAKGTWVSNTPSWNALKILDKGEFIAEGITFIEASALFLAFNHKSDKGELQTAYIMNCKFIGSFADAIGVGSNPIGRTNLTLVDCQFKFGYDNGKQCINFNSTGDLVVQGCIFERSNRDGDIVLQRTGSEKVGNVTIKRCLFNGKLSFYQDFDPNIANDPFVAGLGGIGKKHVGTLSHVSIDVNSCTKLEIEDCIFTHYERAAINISDTSDQSAAIERIDAHGLVVNESLLFAAEEKGGHIGWNQIRLYDNHVSLGETNYCGVFVKLSSENKEHLLSKTLLVKDSYFFSTGSKNALSNTIVLRNTISAVNNSFIKTKPENMDFKLSDGKLGSYNFNGYLNLVNTTLNANKTSNSKSICLRTRTFTGDQLLNADSWDYKTIRRFFSKSSAYYLSAKTNRENSFIAARQNQMDRLNDRIAELRANSLI